MDPDLKYHKPFSENTDREKVKFKKQLFLYLFFLLVAVLFWYLNALNKTYTTNLNYTVSYQGNPKGKVLISEPNSKLSIQVKGNGFHLLRFKLLSLIQSIDLDLQEFSSQIDSTSNPYHYVLASSSLQNMMSSLFNTVQINRIAPDSLFFIFTETVDKKVAIKPNLKLEFEKTYMQKGAIRVIPDSILVSGPKAIIDTLQFVNTQLIEIKEIKNKVVAEAELNSIEHFIFPFQKVKIVIPAEKYTEIVYTIPIESENIPSGLEIKTFPATINLSFDVILTDFDKMNSNLFKAAVDYNNVVENHPKKLKVNLIKSPPEAKNIKFTPKIVDYIVE